MEIMVTPKDEDVRGDHTLCVGHRLFGWPNFMGVVSHVLFDQEGEPIYFTKGGDNQRGSDRIYHYMVGSGMVHPGQRTHPRTQRLRTLNV